LDFVELFTSHWARRRIFFEDISRQLSFSFLAVSLTASCADLLALVFDNPSRCGDEVSRFVSFGGAQPETGSFGGTRHFSNISKIEVRVVQSFPATREIVRFPRFASLRIPLTVNPKAAAAS
jgi:hypothetical protein